MSTSLEFLRANPTALFEYVLAHYFRRHSPFTPTLSFTFLDSQPVKVRRIIAASSNSPDVLEHLAGDIDPWTRETARRSRYWLFLGQFRQLIEMNRRDKIRFIQNEPFTSILPFVVFDTDPEVLGAALENPNISIKMLLNLDRFLDEKSPTMPDRQLRDLVKRVIAIRRNRVLKVSTIFSAVNHTRSGRTTLALFPLLLDRDNLIRKSAIRAIQRLTPEELKSALGYQSEMAELVREGTVFVWHLLRELPVLYNQPDADLQAWIADQKTVLLDHCLTDLSHHRNLQTLAYAHTDPDAHLRRQAQERLSLEDLISLISDESYPRGDAITILEVLQKHSDPTAKSRVEDALLKVSERGRTSLKEMEVSIKACFDVMFTYGEGLLNDRHPENQLSTKEIGYLRETIQEVLEAAEQFSASAAPATGGTAGDPEAHRARLLWRATIGQYLGRIKQLDNLLKEAWARVVNTEFPDPEIRRETEDAEKNLELDYKEEVSCHLTIGCAMCMKRTCAAERYLRQANFFLEELSDYIDFEKGGKKNTDRQKAPTSIKKTSEKSYS